MEKKCLTTDCKQFSLGSGCLLRLKQRDKCKDTEGFREQISATYRLCNMSIPSLNITLGQNPFILSRLHKAFRRDAWPQIAAHHHRMEYEKLKPPVIVRAILISRVERERDPDNYIGGMKWLVDMIKNYTWDGDDDKKNVQDITIDFETDRDMLYPHETIVRVIRV